MLLRVLLELLDAWRPAFHQDRSGHRAAAQALGLVASPKFPRKEAVSRDSSGD